MATDFIVLTNSINDKFCWGYIYLWRIERMQYTDWMETVPVDDRADDWQQWIDYRESLRSYHGWNGEATPEQAAVFWDANAAIEPSSFLTNPFERVTAQDYRDFGSIAQSLQTMGVSDDDAIRIATEGQFADVAAFEAEVSRYTNPSYVARQAEFRNQSLKAYGLSMGLKLTQATRDADTLEEAEWEWYDPAITTEQGQLILDQQGS